MEVQSPIVENDGKDIAHFEFVSYPKYYYNLSGTVAEIRHRN